MEVGTTHFKLDIETEFASPTEGVVNKWAADMFRRLADRVERGELFDGHHGLTDNVGKTVGTVYAD